MSVGTLAGVPFILDPESVAYHFDIKSNSQDTVGGKVVQVYGTTISEMAVTGSFGISGWQAQQTFLNSITAQMTNQVGTYTSLGYVAGTPIRFTYPPRNWDFQVFVLNYSQPGGTSSVLLDNTIINPQWTLTMFIVAENGTTVGNNSALASVQNAALASYLSRLAQGLGWKAGETYNGPVATQISPTAAATAGGAQDKSGTAQKDAGST